MCNFRNLTIDVGQNPHVDGIRWCRNNSSFPKNVRTTGTGRVGINSGWLGQKEPNLIQDALVQGSFETGVRCAWSWGQTLSRVTVRKARTVGISANAAVGIEDLVVEETPVALNNEYPNDGTRWGGVVALVGERFTGSDAGRPAIPNTSVLYAREVTGRGSQQVLQSSTPGGSFTGATIDGYLSHPAKRLFPEEPETALKLSIRTESLVPWKTDLSNWVWAIGYGAKYGENGDGAAAPHHLHTVHSAHEFASARFHHDDAWLDVNLGHTYGPAYLQILPEYQRTNPVRLVILGKTGYEAEPNVTELLPDAKRGELWTPYRIRRNVRWAVTSGGMGYCAGTRLWRWEPNWWETMQVRSIREAPLLLRGLETIAWWWLVPNAKGELLTAGLGESKGADRATAALADGGSCGIVCLPTPRTITVDIAKVRAPGMVRWFDPTPGEFTIVEGAPFTAGGKREFRPRGANSAGESDWVVFRQAESPGSSGKESVWNGST